MSQIAVDKFSIILLASFLTCARDASSFQRRDDAGLPIRGGRVVLLFSNFLVRLFNDEPFLKLFEVASFELTHTILAFWRTQEISSSELACVRLFPYLVAESAVQ